MERINRARKRLIVFRTLNKSKIKIGSCFCLAAVIALAGFMGIDNFKPDERTVQIDADVSAAPPVIAETSGLAIDGKSAILIDAGSGAVLFSQNSNERLPPASVTKIMTMLLILEAVDREQIGLADLVTVSPRAASMGGSQMYMEPGEQHPLSDLMMGIAMVSANDACVAAAEYVSGTVEIFVEHMNQRATELGMKDTNFVNTNGLPVANHYSSAYDIALMSRELMKHSITQEWFTTWQSTIKVGLPGKETEFGLTNTNRLIKQYTGANGIKTGFTQDAGYCLAGSATRGDMTLIAVIMGSPSSKIRFAEVEKMLDYGFATYDTVKIAEKGEPADSIKVDKGSPETLNAVAGEDIFILVKKGEREGIKADIELYPNLMAPLEKGQQIGDVVIYENDKEIERYPLVTEESVTKASLKELYIRMMKNLV